MYISICCKYVYKYIYKHIFIYPSTVFMCFLCCAQIPQNLPCSVTLQPGPEDTGKVPSSPSLTRSSCWVLSESVKIKTFSSDVQQKKCLQNFNLNWINLVSKFLQNKLFKIQSGNKIKFNFFTLAPSQILLMFWFCSSEELCSAASSQRGPVYVLLLMVLLLGFLLQACGVDFEIRAFCAKSIEEKIHKRWVGFWRFWQEACRS